MYGLQGIDFQTLVLKRLICEVLLSSFGVAWKMQFEMVCLAIFGLHVYVFKV